MEQQVKNPLVIRCEYCAGDLSFDIAKQKYCCAHCGAEAGTAEKKAEYRRWKSLRQEVVLKDIGKVKSFSCPACGAQTMATGDDVSAKCPFCQNTMIDTDFAGNDLPEVILPFKITLDDAKARLKQWIANNKSNAAAEVIEKNLPRLTGCYLPYHIVRGALGGDMHVSTQSGSAGYPFKAYLSHTAVNASKDWDNLFLDGLEPFEFEEAREFDFGYLNHQNAKLQNVETQTLKARIEEETKNELFGSLTKKIRTKEMFLSIHDNDSESLPALMPVFVVKGKNGVAAAVNGQTGKVSIATGKTKNLTGRWWLWPTLATLAVYFGSYLWGSTADSGPGGLQIGLAMAAVFGIVFFVIAHQRHSDTIVHEVLTDPKTEESHNDTRTEFFANFGQGYVPAKLKFFTPWRIIKTILIAAAVIFLPALIAIPVQLLRGNPISDIQLGYGAAWYCIPGFFTILGAGGLAKAMMYGSPLYYEILPDGKTRHRRTVNQKRIKMKDVWDTAKILFTTKLGCFFTGFFLLLLIVSVSIMTS